MKLLVWGCLVAVLQVDAQVLRDPTVPPPATGLSASPMASRAPDFGSDAFGVIVRDGRPYLVQGSLLYGQGQQVGQTRIERITETAVWLREDGVLRKESLFPGIQLRVLPSNALPPGGPSAPPKTALPSAACVRIHSHCSSQKIEKFAP
ncbi:MAG: hypothetical protein H7172_02310 [Ferruginibacter sp.]|nr:hypothetical protein [Rhodoferax sp.]